MDELLKDREDRTRARKAYFNSLSGSFYPHRFIDENIKDKTTGKDERQFYIALENIKESVLAIEFPIMHVQNDKLHFAPDTLSGVVMYKGINAIDHFLERMESKFNLNNIPVSRFQNERFSAGGFIKNYIFILSNLLALINQVENQVTRKAERTSIYRNISLFYLFTLESYTERFIRVVPKEDTEKLKTLHEVINKFLD